MPNFSMVDKHGHKWDSSFEKEVFDYLQRYEKDWSIRRAVSGSDTLSYTSPVRGGQCVGCGGTGVVQQRSYTPDIHISSDKEGIAFYIEAKGFFPGPKRNLYRSVAAQRDDVNLLLVLQQNGWVTRGKTRLLDWAERYKLPAILWKDVIHSDPEHLWDICLRYK